MEVAMTDYHEFPHNRYEEIPGSQYSRDSGGVGVLIAIVALVLFFGALLMFTGSPTQDEIQSGASSSQQTEQQQAPVKQLN
jgi:hypothetical protein